MNTEDSLRETKNRNLVEAIVSKDTAKAIMLVEDPDVNLDQ